MSLRLFLDLPHALRASINRLRAWLVRRVKRSTRAELTMVSGASGIVQTYPQDLAWQTTADHAVKKPTMGAVILIDCEKGQLRR